MEDGSGETPRDAAHRPTKMCARCGTRYPADRIVCRLDGEVLGYDPKALVGMTLDETYTIERMLGGGGMGTVYLARHALLQDRVALKVMSAGLAANPDWLRRFLREGRAARLIRHPSVVSVYDLRHSSEGIAYLVMEYVDGRTLRSYLDERGKLSVPEAVSILRPVAEALDEAHALGVVHRDLKPSNIMLGEAGGRPSVKLMDLGIAKLLDADDASIALTGVGQILGTPRYMSPEQWDGTAAIDGRADVYGLGGILYEMITGRPPFTVTSTHALMLAHMTAQPRPPHEVSDVPAVVGGALLRALSKAPAERQATAGALLDEVAERWAAFERAEQTAPDGAEATEPAPAPARAPRRRARAALVAGAALLAVVLGGLAVAGAFKAFRPDGGEAALLPPAPAPPVERALDFVLTVQKYRDGRPEGSPFASDGRNIFEENFRVRLLVGGSTPGSLVVLNEAPAPDPATGAPRYTVLFPDPATNGGSSRLAPGGRVQVPASDWIWFDDEKGTETLWLIWSAEPIEALEGLEQAINARDQGVVSDPARSARIRDLILAHAPAGRDVRTDDATRVTTVRTSGGVLVHPLRLEHQ